MRTDLDTLLLDRLFQPVADLLCGAASCFGLARLSLAAAALLQFVALSGNLLLFGDAVQRTLAGAITLLALIGADQTRGLIGRAERQTRSGHMNLRRITLRWQRLAWLVAATWAVGTGVTQPSLATAAAGLAALAWLATIYFVSCTPREPTRQVGRHLAFATF